MPHKIFQQSFLLYQKEKYEEIALIKSEFDTKGKLLLPHLNLLPLAACVTNKEGYYIDVNKKYIQLTGYKKKELIGKHVSKVITQLTKQQITDIYEQFWLEGEHENQKYLLKTKAGNTRRVLANASKIADENSIKKVTFIADITSWDRARINILERAEQINSNLEIQRRALEVAIHDIKNYVSNISFSSEMLMDEILDTHQKNYLNIIYKNSRAIGNHISDLSRIIRIENGDYQTSISDFNVITTINDIVKEFDGLIKSKQLKITIKKGFSAPLVLNSDIFCFISALKNLIKNAIEASPKSEQVTIEVKSDEKVHISIHNYGAIPAEIQDRFFQKYVTSSANNNAKNFKGSGLGTYIAKKMINQISGEISFTSSLKTGTTIFLTLPLQNTSQPDKKGSSDVNDIG